MLNPIDISVLVSRIFWSFDNTFQDLYNGYNGVGSNTPTFSSPGYNGAGKCLSLDSASSQSVTVTSPFLNITYKSFTLEVWMYAYSLTLGGDNSIFGQYEINTLDHALHLIIRDQYAYFGFFSDDIIGNLVSEDILDRFIAFFYLQSFQLLSDSEWYHIVSIEAKKHLMWISFIAIDFRHMSMTTQL